MLGGCSPGWFLSLSSPSSLLHHPHPSGAEQNTPTPIHTFTNPDPSTIPKKKLAAPSDLLIVPVEKGRFSDAYTLRLLCFDPATRMAYLSDKGAKAHYWKRRRLCAAVPKLFEARDDDATSRASAGIDFLSDKLDARELLSLVLHGVSHGQLEPDSTADRAVMQGLLSLLNVTFEYAYHTTTREGGRSTGGRGGGAAGDL